MTADEFVTHKEPDEIFLPLSPERYSLFYAMEMQNFCADLPFYRERISRAGPTLELGCGNGRLCRLLAATGTPMTGIDISLPMLRLALPDLMHPFARVVMDMTALAFRRCFDTVILPYHTFNLLLDPERIRVCLHEIAQTLRLRGRLLMQIFIPDQHLMDLQGKKLFQFQIFEQPDGGRIIKETRRSCQGQQLILEERYRIRPGSPGQQKEDLSHTLPIAAFSLEQWRHLLQENDFIIEEELNGYDFRPFKAGQDSCLFINARLDTPTGSTP